MVVLACILGSRGELCCCHVLYGTVGIGRNYSMLLSCTVVRMGNYISNHLVQKGAGENYVDVMYSREQGITILLSCIVESRDNYVVVMFSREQCRTM